MRYGDCDDPDCPHRDNMKAAHTKVEELLAECDAHKQKIKEIEDDRAEYISGFEKAIRQRDTAREDRDELQRALKKMVECKLCANGKDPTEFDHHTCKIANARTLAGVD